jgi:hypothetical protein
MVSQGLLFSEPSVAETGVWCALSDGIDPAEWAGVCRYIGTRRREEFEHIRDTVMSALHRKNKSRFNSGILSSPPLISIGPSGIGGQFQQEHF